VFPQLAGLGSSTAAQYFGIRDREEAEAYLRDDVLRTRYEEIGSAIDQHLASGSSAEGLMGSHIDALKLVSSVTLFGFVAAQLSRAEPESTFNSMAQLCERLLSQLGKRGFPPCAHTLNQLKAADE
jgi:uncharacterized protein (DUF1810 family)